MLQTTHHGDDISFADIAPMLKLDRIWCAMQSQCSFGKIPNLKRMPKSPSCGPPMCHTSETRIQEQLTIFFMKTDIRGLMEKLITEYQAFEGTENKTSSP